MAKNTKLELTWIGKDKRPRLEPRVLIEDPTKSYHAAVRHGDKDIFDNMLIHGDNLLALKALEQQFAGKVKCIYIDPPFNTGAAFEHYDDNLEHSIWLGLMRERFSLLHTLLREDGCIFINLDDSEVAYAKVLLDEVFGRINYFNDVIVATNSSFGFKSTSTGIFKQANHLLLYAKDRTKVKLNMGALFVEKGYDSQYKWTFDDERKESWHSVREVVAKEMGYSSAKEASKKCSVEFDSEVADYAISHAELVFRTAAVTGGALQKRRTTIEFSKTHRNEVVRHPNDDMDYMFIGGERVLPYKERLRLIDGRLLPAEILTDIWNDVSIEGLAKEGGVSFPKGKKPEKLIRRCLELASNPGDLVLDSFLGSGTTAAVAHKMGRRWIGIELGDHCYTHCLPRLKGVVDGADQTGISKPVNWKGGGGYRFYELAPTLIKEDAFGQKVINKEYNAEMLAEAVCKLEGFTYAPSETEYFIHGHSTERDFIYVTTNYMTAKHLVALNERVGGERSLLVCCKGFTKGEAKVPNLTVKKIPKAVLDKCEYGHDDYSLNVKNLPMAEKPLEQGELFD